MDLDWSTARAETEGAKLAPAERLLLCALHSWVNADDAVKRRALTATLSDLTSPRVGALFLAWMQEVEAARLRPLTPSCRGCSGFGPDLQRLVVACGAAPVAFEAGEKLLQPLLADAASTMVLARSLNGAMAACGWRLPVRLAAPPHGLPSTATRH
jgi:hypothetical protein